MPQTPPLFEPDWLIDADTALLDTPNSDGLTERAYWHVSIAEDGSQGSPFFETFEEVPEPYNPFDYDRTDIEA